MPDIFISYAREDQATARRFAEAFEREGFSVWWDATLNPGEAFDEVTEKALGEAKAVVVLWSKHSVASRWVRSEATQAHESRTLVPVMIEPCKRPIMFELTHTADLSHWTGDPSDSGWLDYLAGVRRFMGKDAVGAPSPHTAMPAINRPRRITLTAIALSVGALLIAGMVLWLLNRAPGSVKKPAAATEVSLAVLPFADMSTAHDQESFSDGLSEEILNQLAQVRDLRLIGRTSSFSFKGKNEDLRVIGEKLGVSNLLEGSIRKEGNQLRITAQLINARDGSHRWSQTYARELKDIFTVQEEIAKDVAQALSVRLDVGDMRLAQGGTTNVEAYEKYLHARTLFNQLGPKELVQAMQLYREALALDPGFARAWSGLHTALSYSLTWIPENSAAALKEMSEARARVEALAPDAWWTQTLRVSQFDQQRKWSEAEVAANAALASAPASEIEATRSYANFTVSVGRINESLDYFRRARQMDPLSLGTSGLLQLALDDAGQPEEAQAEYERSKDLAGDHAIWDWWAVQRLWRRTDAKLADVEAQYHVLLDHESLPMALTHVVADRLGDREAALVAIREAFKDPSNQDGTRMSVVAEYADHFGDKDLALAAIRRSSVELRAPGALGFWQPFESGLRSDPRFKDIVRDLGLVDYWRASGNWGDFCKPVGKEDFECH